MVRGLNLLGVGLALKISFLLCAIVPNSDGADMTISRLLAGHGTQCFSGSQGLDVRGESSRRSLVAQPITTGRVLWDYIGSNGIPITYADVPINSSNGITYVLALSFAIDANGTTGTTSNGKFAVFWNPTLNGTAAKAWRAKYSNSRIIIALGGSVYYDTHGNEHSVDWYDPPNQSQWLTNAVNTLTNIITTYGADGIDIDYERFPAGSATFIDTMGKLITTLKNNNVIKIVSIAPGYDQLNLYSTFYDYYGNLIDIINYQFYGEGLNTSAKYIARFNEVAQLLPTGKLGLSTQTALDSNTITGTVFFQTIQNIRSGDPISGVYLWNADLSKTYNNFANERGIASFL